MMHHPLKIIFLSVLAGFSITACSTVQTSDSNTVMPLEQVNNIGASPTTENNVAKLLKQGQNCVIEFTGNFEGGRAVEHWTFNHSGLIAANSSTQHTANTALASAHIATAFDIENPAVQANFKKLQSNFSASNLAQCQ